MMARQPRQKVTAMADTTLPPEVAAYVVSDPRIPDVRFAENEYHIFAPPGYCGDLNCVCADEARKWMNAKEWRLSYGTCAGAIEAAQRAGRMVR